VKTVDEFRIWLDVDDNAHEKYLLTNTNESLTACL
jgi:hypothetical protein